MRDGLFDDGSPTGEEAEMIRRIEYQNEGRKADIDYIMECEWRVWLTEGKRWHTTFRRSLTSAQSTAREFLRTGVFPR